MLFHDLLQLVRIMRVSWSA